MKIEEDNSLLFGEKELTKTETDPNDSEFDKMEQ